LPRKVDDGIKKRCGCGRAKWPKCSHGWHFGFHHGGREHRLSLDVVAAERRESAPRTKAEAVAWRDRLRSEIRAGGAPDRAPVEASTPATAVTDTRLTFGDVADVYVRMHVRRPGRRSAGRKLMEWYVRRLRAVQVSDGNGGSILFEQKLIADLTTADILEMRAGWTRRRGSHNGHIGAERALKRLRHLFNWAIEAGYVDATPFRRHGVAVVHFEREKPRTRRLEPGEGERLLAAAAPHLRALIVAALETGARPAELLGLCWRDVQWHLNAILLPADVTKTGVARDLPMTQRLKGLLDLRRHAPDGVEHPPDAFVFGTDTGERVRGYRAAWTATCAAAGVKGLQFRDLRREFASRLRETPGIADHHVRDMLGHADLATTSRYLATTRVGLQQAMKVFEQHRAGFTHGLHKPSDQALISGEKREGENDAKSLN
jgi:integrase